MSEWEEFSAYRGIIQDAKNEARKEIIHDRKAIAEYATKKECERIINKLMSNLIEFQYFDGLKSHRINATEHTKDEAETILRNIIKDTK